MTQHTVQDMMVAYAEDGIDYAQQTFGVTLEYSQESVQLVEEMLAKLHEDAAQKGFFARLIKKTPSDESIHHLAKMLGGYVGEVMRRHWGGEWKLESEAFPGEEVITLQLNGGDVWPHFKAGKRIVDGPEDNVWAYFQVLEQKYGN